MGARDLTTLQNVKTFLGGPIAGAGSADSDALLNRLITSMSAAFVNETNREILRQSYSLTLDSTDERVIRGRYGSVTNPASGFAINLIGPVIGDPTLTVDGTAVAKRTSLTGDGWVLLDGYRLEVVGTTICYGIWYGVGNITVSWEAGEYIPSEAATVPSVSPYTVQASQALGAFVSDIGVKYASDGTALTKVASSPSVGQYSVSSTGLYTFAAADSGVGVLLSYAYLPSDVEECVIEMVAFKYKKRERLDQVSANLGGQLVYFNREPWPPTVQSVIDGWARPNL